MGTGILGLPPVFVKLGGVLGFLFLCICCLLNIWAMKTVIRWKEKTGVILTFKLFKIFFTFRYYEQGHKTPFSTQKCHGIQ